MLVVTVFKLRHASFTELSPLKKQAIQTDRQSANQTNKLIQDALIGKWHVKNYIITFFVDRSPHIDRTSRLSEDDELDDITNSSSI